MRPLCQDPTTPMDDPKRSQNCRHHTKTVRSTPRERRRASRGESVSDLVSDESDAVAYSANARSTWSRIIIIEGNPPRAHTLTVCSNNRNHALSLSLSLVLGRCAQ